MVMAKKSMFAKINTAEVSRDANYFSGSGDYLVKITRMKQGENRKGIGNLIVEATVIHRFTDTAHHQIGDEVSWTISTSSDYFLSDVIKFVEALFGENMQEYSQEEADTFMDALTNEEDNPMCNTIARVVTRDIVGKNVDPDTGDKKVFTKVNWKEEVSAVEALEILSDKAKTSYFPAGYLDKKASEA